MELSAERKKRIANLRRQLPFLNKYQKESQNEELKKHSLYIMNLFKKADNEKKDINIPDHKIDLLIASVEKLKEYTRNVKTQNDESKNPPQKAVDPPQKVEDTKPMTQLPTSVVNTSTTDESLSLTDLNISDKERKRREKEIRRLQENIVKADCPLPSRRVIKRNSKYLNSTNETAESIDETPSHVVKRKSDADKISSKKSLPVKSPSIDLPSSLPFRSSRSTTDIKSEKSLEFTTSTPKNVKPSAVFERILPMKRRSDVSLEKLAKDEKVPPLKFSTLARKAAEKSTEFKRVLPSVRKIEKVESPVVNDNLKVKKTVSNPDMPEDDFKLKKILLKSPEKIKSKEMVLAKEISSNDEDWEDVDENSMDIDSKCETKVEEIQAEKKQKLNRRDIENMGYVAVRNGFIFQCLAENCLFNTMKKFSFINHLEENHLNIQWSGNCKSCSSDVVTKDKSKEGEFWHMMEKHVHDENNSPENLPDITEIPKEIISEDTTESLTLLDEIQSKEKIDDDTTLSDDSCSNKLTVVKSNQLKIKAFADIKKIGPSSTHPKELPMRKNEPQVPTADDMPKRITVRNFASMSKFSPQATQSLKPLETQKSMGTIVIRPKPYDLVKQDTEKEPTISPVKQFDKLLVRPKVAEIPKKDVTSEQGTAGKSQIHNLKALMQKQTEENLRKLKSAAKNAQIIPTKVSSPDEQPSHSIENPVKFYIRKSTGNDDVQVEDNRLPKDAVSLRPWISKPIKKYLNRTVKLLATPALVAKFKCMGAKCEYFTDDRRKFNSHLEAHVDATPGDIASYIVCPYCDFDFTNFIIKDLIEHIENQHGFDKYQCKYCFYRSCANFNVLEHQKIHHRMQQHNIIMLENVVQRNYKREMENVKVSCMKFIKPLVCATCKLNTGSTKKYFVLKQYLNHLKHHERLKEVIRVNCRKCSKQVVSAENVYAHILECFENCALYQCVYCLFGSNSIVKIQEHMCNFHPSKMSLLCVRTDEQPMKENAMSHEYQSTSLFFITMEVDDRYITTADGKMASKNSVEHTPVSSGSGKQIQIQNVYSLSTYNN